MIEAFVTGGIVGFLGGVILGGIGVAKTEEAAEEREEKMAKRDATAIRSLAARLERANAKLDEALLECARLREEEVEPE